MEHTVAQFNFTEQLIQQRTLRSTSRWVYRGVEHKPTVNPRSVSTSKKVYRGVINHGDTLDFVKANSTHKQAPNKIYRGVRHQ